MKPIGFVFLALLAGILVWKQPFTQAEGRTVAILQTASHPALDRAREGFVAKLREEFGEEVRIRVQNAEGMLSQARSIAKRFHLDRNVEAIFTIGSLATQMMAEVEKEKPIVFSAVTDPSALGLSANVTGSRDLVDVGEMVQLVQALVPSAERVALLFTPSEVNSVALVSHLKIAFEGAKMEVVEVGIHQESEVVTATTLAAKRGDVIVTPTDNLVASTAPVIAAQALKQGTPLIVSDNLLVEKGALAAKGVDYEASGRQAGEMVVRLLHQEVSVEEIPIAGPVRSPVHINRSTLSQLGLQLPSELASEATLIGGGK